MKASTTTRRPCLALTLKQQLFLAISTIVITLLTFNHASSIREIAGEHSLIGRKERVAVCFGGNARTFRFNFTHDYVLTHIIKPLRMSYDTDVFFTISTDDYQRGKWLPTSPADPNSTMSAVLKLNPVQTRLLTKHSDDLPISRIHRKYRNGQPPIDVLYPPSSCQNVNNASIRVAHTLLRAQQCLSLIQSEERKKGIRYDWIYRLRPDVIIFDDILLPETLERGVYYTNQGRTNVTAKMGRWWAERHGGKAGDGAVADQIGIMSRDVAEEAMRAFEAGNDCEIFTAPFLALPEEVLRFWLLKKGIRYRAVPFDWVIVRETNGLECHRLFHQFGVSPNGWIADWKRSMRRCWMIANSTQQLFPRMPSVSSKLHRIDLMQRLPNEVITA